MIYMSVAVFVDGAALQSLKWMFFPRGQVVR